MPTSSLKPLLTGLWKDYRSQVVAVVALSVLSALTGGVGLVMLVPMLGLVDGSSGAGDVLWRLLPGGESLGQGARLVLVLGAYVLLLAAKGVLSYVLSIKKSQFTQDYTYDLRTHLYRWQVTRADWQWLRARKQSDLLNLFTMQCNQVTSLVNTLIGLVTMGFSATVQLVLALALNVPLTLTVCAVGAALVLASRPYLARSSEYGKQLVDASRAVYAELHDQVNGVKEVRAYGVGQLQSDRFDRVSEEYRSKTVAYTRYSAKPGFVYSMVAAIMVAAAFALSVLVLHTDTVTLVVLVFIFSRLWPQVTSLYGSLQNIKSLLPAYDMVREVQLAMEAQTAREPQECAAQVPFERAITFDNVEFAFPDDDAPTLRGLSFSIPRGLVTVLAGPSGAGKSTTADLLLGFLRPTGGRILVDDLPLDASTVEAWRRHVGYVPQDLVILNASVRENIARFHPGVSDDEIVDALRKTRAWEFVSELPEGLDTLLGDRGVRLSGGQRQRVVLARVMVGRPDVIVLDEATNALDARVDEDIRTTMRELCSETTFVVIAHHLATARSSDRAVVIEDGTVSEVVDLHGDRTLDDTYLAHVVGQ